MNSPSLVVAWVQLLALLAAEVGLVALGVALLRYWSPSAAWRRTFCQTGIAAVLIITACELSGSARLLGNWAANALAWRHDDRSLQQPAPRALPQPPFYEPESVHGLIARFATVGALQEPEPEFPLTPTPLPEERGTGRAASVGRFAVPAHAPMGNGAFQEASLARRLPTLPPLPFGRGEGRGEGSVLPDPVSDSMGVLWLWLVWAVGATLAGGRVCLAQCLFFIFRLRRRPVSEPALATRVQALARALGIRRRVRVVESKRLTGPIASGLIWPVVGLPADFTRRFDTARQDAMLAHELAHLAAHDPFWCLLADVATVVLWWHPAVWWLRGQLHLATEMAADEASLLVADGPRVLAECLVELGARLTRPLLIGQLRVSGFRSHLGRRVQRLLHLEGRAWLPLPRFGAALVRVFGPMAMTAIVVLCTAWAAPQALTRGNSMKTMQLNWKRSLATFALLAAFNGPDATVAVAQSEPPAAPPVSAPQEAPAPPAAVEAPDAGSQTNLGAAVPKAPSPAERAEEAFRRRYGLSAPPSPGPSTSAEDAFRQRYGYEGPPSTEVPTVYTNRDQAIEAFRKRYGLGSGRFSPPQVSLLPAAKSPTAGAKSQPSSTRLCWRASSSMASP